MARTVADINRACSPMYYIEENLNESTERIQEKKRILEEARKSKSPFLIGSIEEVNRRISNLDKELQSYTQLVIESRASEKNDDLYIPPSSAKLREFQQRKDKETKELNRFAGIYTIKATFLAKPSERIKNISKISMQASKVPVKKDSGKPKFVELHQYPGYDSKELTPLPHGVTPVEILTKVANAQPSLNKMPRYRPVFEKLFYSAMSQAILQDTFWWIFLEKWQPNSSCQEKLFNRIAHNYVKLLNYVGHSQYRETFFKDYPSLLSQAVYAAFCGSFPDSYRMFDPDFKEDLVVLVYEWVVGTRPAPRIWLSWNYKDLEPPGLKQREKLMKQSKSNKAPSLSLEFLDMLGTSNIAGSQSTLNQTGSISSMSSLGGPATGRHGRMNRKQQSNKTTKNKSLNPSHTADMAAIQAVEKAQNEPTTTRVQTGVRKASRSYPTARAGKPTEKISGTDCLTTITEHDETEEQEQTKESKASFLLQQKSSSQESHPVGKMADFVRSAFNTHGQSPLVAHFLQMKHLQIDAGSSARIKRTELHNLPPLDAPTYKDLIAETFRTVRERTKNYSKLTEMDKEEHKRFIRNQKKQLAEFKKKEALLLSNPSEVKRISDLIMLELKKDHDSIGTGVSNEIDAALAALE